MRRTASMCDACKAMCFQFICKYLQFDYAARSAQSLQRPSRVAANPAHTLGILSFNSTGMTLSLATASIIRFYTFGFWGRFHPATLSCFDLDKVSWFSGVSLVIVDPAPIVDPLEILTGATSCVSDPINTSSSMIV